MSNMEYAVAVIVSVAFVIGFLLTFDIAFDFNTSLANKAHGEGAEKNALHYALLNHHCFLSVSSNMDRLVFSLQKLDALMIEDDRINIFGHGLYLLPEQCRVPAYTYALLIEDTETKEIRWFVTDKSAVFGLIVGKTPSFIAPILLRDEAESGTRTGVIYVYK